MVHVCLVVHLQCCNFLRAAHIPFGTCPWVAWPLLFDWVPVVPLNLLTMAAITWTCIWLACITMVLITGVFALITNTVFDVGFVGKKCMHSKRYPRSSWPYQGTVSIFKGRSRGQMLPVNATMLCEIESVHTRLLK